MSGGDDDDDGGFYGRALPESFSTETQSGAWRVRNVGSIHRAVMYGIESPAFRLAWASTIEELERDPASFPFRRPGSQFRTARIADRYEIAFSISATAREVLVLLIEPIERGGGVFAPEPVGSQVF
jgi:hypothetical protein